jgi:hypothetical protein
MKRFLAAGAAVAAVAAAVFVGRADAILLGTPDGNDHKGVGYIVFYDGGNTPLWRCTGSLVSTRVLLTAGHCAGRYQTPDGVFHTPVRAQVWFDKQIKASSSYAGGPCDGVKGWPCSGGDAIGLPIPHPDYSGDLEGTVNDLGVVLLAKQMKEKDVLDLAPLGTLERTAPGTPFTIVGYGNQSVTPPPVDQRERMQGTVRFAFLDEEAPFADFTNGPVAGGPAAPSSVCVGDSGGPVLDSRDRIVAVIALIDSTKDGPGAVPGGDGFCQGVAYHTRTDSDFAKQFLQRVGVDVSGSDGDSHEGHHGKKHGRNANEG